MPFVATEGQERSLKVMGCRSRSLESTCQEFQGPHSWHHLVHSLNTFSRWGGEEKETIKYWHKKSRHNVIVKILKLSNTVLTRLLPPPPKKKETQKSQE